MTAPRLVILLYRRSQIHGKQGTARSSVYSFHFHRYLFEKYDSIVSFYLARFAFGKFANVQFGWFLRTVRNMTAPRLVILLYRRSQIHGNSRDFLFPILVFL